MKNPTITDIAAVLISAAALLLSITQGVQTIISNKISVRPNVDITFNGVRGSSEAHGFKIKNSGVGPAIIDEVNYYVDGKLVDVPKLSKWSNILDQIGWDSPVNFTNFHIIHLPKGYYLQKGQNEYLFKLLPGDGPHKRELSSSEWAKLNRVGVEVKYVSMHDEYFSIHYTPANESPYVRSKCKK